MDGDMQKDLTFKDQTREESSVKSRFAVMWMP